MSRPGDEASSFLDHSSVLSPHSTAIMDPFFLSSRATRPQPLYSTTLNHRNSASSSAKSPTSLSFSLRPHFEPGPDNANTNSSAGPSNSVPSNPLRRPHTAKKPASSSSSSSSSSKPGDKIPRNPLKNLFSPSHVPPPPIPSSSASLSDKLWLYSKLAPPPPLPPQEIDEDQGQESENREPEDSSSNSDLNGPSVIDYREKDKIFVGNLPSWIKKNEVAEFFRQFGPIKNVILIKGHNETERNAGFGFVVYGGPTAAKSAMKAVEFDGVEFHGRVLTVKLDDGRRVKTKAEERLRYVEGHDGTEFPSKWHEEREGSRNAFRKVLETEPENWQAVVSAFERIKKV